MWSTKLGHLDVLITSAIKRFKYNSKRTSSQRRKELRRKRYVLTTLQTSHMTSCSFWKMFCSTENFLEWKLAFNTIYFLLRLKMTDDPTSIPGLFLFWELRERFPMIEVAIFLYVPAHCAGLKKS